MGPFKVVIQHREKNIGNLHQVELGKILHQNNVKGIMRIKKKEGTESQ